MNGEELGSLSGTNLPILMNKVDKNITNGEELGSLSSTNLPILMNKVDKNPYKIKCHVRNLSVRGGVVIWDKGTHLS